MTTTAGGSLWETLDHTPSPRQRGFLRYLTATLVDLVVLGLFAQYWDKVSVDSFTVMLLAAALLQLLLKLTIALEHRLATSSTRDREALRNSCATSAPGWCSSGPSS